MVLEIDSVELYFKDKRILNGIYLKAKTGTITSILGSNGCGKSCLLHITFGTLKAKYKLVRLNGNVLKTELYKTNKAALLPQYNFAPNQAKVITIFNLFKVKWDDFTNQFEAFSKFKHFKFGKLSGGERRVIEIYLILKKQAEIVILDEPFTGVAPLYITKIQDLIVKEKQHKAILLSDHRYKEVIAISDTIYLLKNGCTKLIDNIKELEDYSYLSIGSLD